MINFRGFIANQGKYLLDNKWHALVHATVLAVLPYTAWLSVAIIALITLRKGWRAGLELLTPVLLIYFAVSMIQVHATFALINSLLTFLPCFIAACLLRATVSWQVVMWGFLLQSLIALVLVQVLYPDFVIAQYYYLQAIVKEVQSDNALTVLFSNASEINQKMLASYFLGLQAVGIIFTACLSLMIARAIQSHLFCRGGLRQELQLFRGDKFALLLMLLVLFAAYQHNHIAVSILPLVALYFLFAGLSLSFNVLARKRPMGSCILIISALVLLPFIMLPVYVIFGSLDSLFNFRIYLANDAGKTV